MALRLQWAERQWAEAERQNASLEAQIEALQLEAANRDLCSYLDAAAAHFTLQEARAQAGAIGATWTGTPLANDQPVPKWAKRSRLWRPRFRPSSSRSASTAMALEALCTATRNEQENQVSELKRQVASLTRDLEASRQMRHHLVSMNLRQMERIDELTVLRRQNGEEDEEEEDDEPAQEEDAEDNGMSFVAPNDYGER